MRMTQPDGTGPYDPQQPGQAPGYGQGSPQQPNYGQPYAQQPMGYTPVEHPQSTTVFVLGIIGIFVGICAFIAWGIGASARKQIKAGAPYPFDGRLKTGYLLGKVFSIIYIVCTVLYFIFFGLLFSAMPQS